VIRLSVTLQRGLLSMAGTQSKESLMRKIALAALFAVSSVALSGQAFAAPHHKVCRIEHKKVHVHGKWVVKNVKICR
jgi:hypothetical protein